MNYVTIEDQIVNLLFVFQSYCQTGEGKMGHDDYAVLILPNAASTLSRKSAPEAGRRVRPPRRAATPRHREPPAMGVRGQVPAPACVA